jgi:hypothetical protein
MKRKRRHEMDYRELAAELARNSIVTKCLARYLEQVIEEVHDSHVKPLREALENIARLGSLDMSNEYEAGLRGIIAAMTDCARNAILSKDGRPA